MFAAPAPAPKPRDPDATKRSGVAVGLCVVTVVLLLAAITGVSVVDEPVHPQAWDPRVRELAQFVQDERGMLFQEPVYVDFLSEDEFELEVTTESADLTAEDRADLEDSTAELRALGLVEGDFDLFTESNDISGGATLAYYSPETERIAVRGTELTPYLRATIVHELTHALQDQHFDLDAIQEAAGPDGDFRFRAVVEGDASNVGDAYRDQLSDDDKQAYDDEESAALSGGQDDPGEGDDAAPPDYAPVLEAYFGAPYALGPTFVSILDAVDGNSGINEALTDLPSSEAAIFDMSLYYDDTEPASVQDPELPEGAEVIDGGSFGALTWYLLLSSRIDPHQALDFVDAWAGDSYTTYREGDTVCVGARYRADSSADLGASRDSLQEWADAMPADAATVTDVDSETIELKSCDPGTDAESTVTNDVATALALPVTRLAIADGTIRDGDQEFDTAWCYADALVDGLTVDQLQSSELTPAMERVVAQARSTCT